MKRAESRIQEINGKTGRRARREGDDEMYYEDWLIRQIAVMIQAIARALFKKDAVVYRIENEARPTDADMLYRRLCDLVAQRKINEAENLLFARADPDRLDDLWLAMDFYQKVNGLDDETLAECDFSREEIMEGIDEILRMFHADMVL